jgi:hypothetical protein
MLPGATGEPGTKLAAFRMPPGLMRGGGNRGQETDAAVTFIGELKAAEGVRDNSSGLGQLSTGGQPVIPTEALRKAFSNSGDDAVCYCADATECPIRRWWLGRCRR